jgi:hypothetical protein
VRNVTFLRFSSLVFILCLNPPVGLNTCSVTIHSCFWSFAFIYDMKGLYELLC